MRKRPSDGRPAERSPVPHPLNERVFPMRRSGKPDPRPSHRPVSSRARLRLEELEDRTAPATVTVTNTSDAIAVDNGVSLREAIASVDRKGVVTGTGGG